MTPLNLADANKQLSGFAWTMAAVIALLLCLVQIGVMASLLVGRAGFAGVFPVSVVVSALAGYLLLRSQDVPRRAQWRASAIFLLLLIASIALSAFFFDLSWDGQWYHQTAIIHIARDWNPLTDPMRAVVNHDHSLILCVRHYAKGPWYFAAAVWATTGHVEWGKSINWLALSASFFAVLGAGLDGELRRRHAVGIALLVAINPVVTSELTTYLVDAVMICFLVVASASLLTCLHRPSAPAFLAGVAGAIVTVNAKFTGLVYLCFALATAGMWCVIWRRRWLPKLAMATLATLALAFCVWGYNPYLTNTYYRHQPFFPLLGSSRYPAFEKSGEDPNELYETPKNMVGRSLPVRFFYATFGRPGNQPYAKGKDASLMWPLTAVPADLYAYKYHETRVSGFGPWFSGCLILALILGGWLIVVRSRGRWLLVLMSLAIITSLSLSRDLWWARYGPQLWLLPILPVAFVWREGVSGYRLILARVLFCLLMADAAIVAGVRLQWETKSSLTLRHQLRQMRESGDEYEVQTNHFIDSTHVRLLEAGVSFKDVGTKPLPDGQELMSVVEEYPRPVHYRRAALPKKGSS